MSDPTVGRPDPAPTDPRTSFTGHTLLVTAWVRMRQHLARTLGFVALLDLGIALLLTALDGGGFHYKLVYSVCISASCMVLVYATRLGFAWAVDLHGALRGLPPSVAAFGGWRGVVPGIALAILVGPGSGLWLADRLTGLRSPSLLELGASNTRVTLVLTLLGTAVSVFALSLLERLASARAQAESAQRLAAETQLALLQSQLEPHMLFNTLANLRVLIGLDPPRAQAMLDRLIAFLRATLKASRQPGHPVAAEFEHLADYLALMSMRMGPRLVVQFKLDEAARDLALPPLLLQPLVENAIKHGLEPKVEGGRIEVGAHREGDWLRLTVRDTGVGLGEDLHPADGTPPAGSAFGLAQIRARLATLYGAAASLTLAPATDAAGGTQATVRLPLAAVAPSAAAGGHPPRP
jgi:signal transduction histidine kinase